MRPPFWRYGLHFDTGQDDLWPEIYCISKGGQWTENGQTFGLGMFEHMMNARKIIWPNRYRHRWTDLLYKEFIQNDLTILVGSASCVSGRTRLLNPATGELTPILELYEKRQRPLVMTLAGPELARIPFVRGFAELFEVTLENGKRFQATSEHRALSESGFLRVREMTSGVRLVSYAENRRDSTADTFPGASLEDACRWWKRFPDSQFDYPIYSRSCGEQPRLFQGIFRETAPSLSDVHTPNECVWNSGDGLHAELTHSHDCPPASHLSSYSAPHAACCTESVSMPQCASSIQRPGFQWCQQRLQSHAKTLHSHTFSKRFHGSIRTATGRDRMPYEPISVALEPIASIKSVGWDVFFDIEVPVARHYFAEGTIHHNSQKTSHAVEYCLLNYWAKPDNTLVILSTVNMDKLDIGCYAELQMLWKAGKERFSWLAGHLLAHKRAITTDKLEEAGMRDCRKGCICRPCYVGGRWVGLGILAGVKQENIFYVADELQFMQEAFSGSWPHLFSNGHVKIIASGNPKHDPDDELGKTAEPREGWSAHPEPLKTDVWDTKFMGGRCINLVGTDSPNFDFPADQPTKFPGLISRKFVDRINHDYGPDSFEAYRLVKGVMKVAFAHSRVITRQLCREHRASDKAEWRDTVQKRVYWLDPSYGGEDACAGGCLEWGASIDDTTIIRLVGYRLYRFNLQSAREVEDQIADILAEELNVYGVESTDAFYDSTGKGTLGGAFARKFGAKAPVPVDSGSQPSRRPVRQDLYVDENDGSKRLKRCDEHYSKFVSEMWFSWRYAIEANQMRELPDEFITEGCARIYEIVAGNKIQVEAKSDPKKKEDLKRRLGHSPNFADGICFSGSTKVLTPDGELEIRKAYPGTKIVTPFGTTLVAICHEAMTDELVRVAFTNGRTLEGTPKHKVFTKDKGWVPLDGLSFTNECESVSMLPLWQLLNELFSRDIGTTFSTQVDTITAARKGLRRRDFYTESFGCNIMALLLKAFVSITRTAIGEIIALPIWNWFRKAFTPPTTCASDGEIPYTESASWKHFLSVCVPLPNGTEAAPVTSGIRNRARNVGSVESATRLNALSAERTSTASLPRAPSSVPSLAPTSSTGKSIKTLFGAVKSAARCLWQTDTKQRAIAPVGVQQLQLHESKRVYNLTLEEHNVFYANGILVKNCIGIEGARQRGFQIANLGTVQEAEADDDYFEKEAAKYQQVIQSKLLARA